MPLLQPALTRFGDGADIYVKQAQGQGTPAVVTGSLDVEGTIFADNFAKFSANTPAPIKIQGDQTPSLSVVRVDAVASGKTLIVGNSNNASGSELEFADTEIKSNKPLYSLTPVPASASVIGAPSIGVQVIIDMTGLDAGIYDAVASAPYSPGDTTVYDVSCPIYWDGTVTRGASIGFVSGTDSASIVTGLLSGAAVNVKYAIINAADAVPREFTLNLYKRTVDVY